MAASVPVTRLLGTCHRNWTLVDIPYRGSEARGVSRAALSQLLLDAALLAGIQVRYGSPVNAVAVRDGQAVLDLQGCEACFDLVVIADGAGSNLPAQAGLAVASTPYAWGALWGLFDVERWPDDTLLEQRYHATNKMFGLMPTARVDGKLRLTMFWSMHCDAYQAWQERPLQDWKDELLALWPQSAAVVNQIQHHAQFAFATYRHARAKRLANGPVCVVGDAAHSMSPQLGLGATLAVQDALTLAQAVQEHGVLAGPAIYSRRRWCAVRAYQSFSRALTPCFQGNRGGLWRDLLFAAGLKVPGVQRVMVRSIASPAGRPAAQVAAAALGVGER
jgi:2-polyprenyl-6-methoxyphenol hydroxylase-like FAD-dependent oxidoreductase